MDISILIPVYNGEKYLKTCIDSCLHQAFRGSYEVVVVNDGSTDSTSEILHSYTDTKLRVFDCKHSGIVDSLNFGIDQCRGKYIARMDSDDIMIAYRLQKQFDFFEKHPEYTIVCGKVVKLYDNGRIGTSQYKVGEILLEDMLQRCCIYHPTVMFRNDGSIRYTHKNEWAEDYSLWLDLLSRGKRIYKMNMPVISYRYHNNQVTQVLRKDSVYQSYNLKLEYGFFNMDKRLDNVIVSLTSHGDRIPFLYRVFESLYCGSVAPSKIFLTLSPKDVERLGLRTQWFIDKGFVELNITDKPYRSHLKYYDVFKKYGKDNIIITIDDDARLRTHWLESLYNTYKEYPDCVSAMVVAKPTFDNANPKSKNDWEFNITNITTPTYLLIAEGVGGVLYPPNIISLPDNIESQIEEFITEDDLLLKKIEMEQNVKVVLSTNHKDGKQRPSPIQAIKDLHDGLVNINKKTGSINYINKIPQHIWDKIR